MSLDRVQIDRRVGPDPRVRLERPGGMAACDSAADGRVRCRRGEVRTPGSLWESEPLASGIFVERIHRFAVRFRRGRTEALAYVANPGRMGEILLPGTELLLARRPAARLGFEVMGARWTRRWPGDAPRTVLLDTGRINTLVGRLLEERLVPELADYEIERTEVRHESSRFDFLLRGRGERRLLEVKSVTLVEHGLALFPDAETARGRRHVEELARLGDAYGRAVVLFFVQGRATHFLPDVHNDLAFGRALRRASSHLDILPYSLEPTFDGGRRLVFAGAPRRLLVPWERTATALTDAGLYLVVLALPRPRRLRIGALGELPFAPGAYVYIGSAQRGLGERVDRHRRRRKRLHWHIDYLREHGDFVAAYPIRGATDECRLAHEIAQLGAAVMPRFGSTDCGCPGHLVRFDASPVHRPEFQELLTRWRHRTLQGLEPS